MPENRNNLIKRLLPLIRILLPRLIINRKIPIRRPLDPSLPRPRGIGSRKVFEGVPTGKDEPIDDPQGENVTPDIVPGSIDTFVCESLGSHKLQDAS